MQRSLRLFLLAGFSISLAACQTHDRVIYDERSPKNLRVPNPNDLPEIPLDTTTPPDTQTPGSAVPSAGGPSAPPAAQ